MTYNKPRKLLIDSKRLTAIHEQFALYLFRILDIILKTVSFSLNQILQSLLDPQNPIYISILLVSFIFSIVYFAYKYGINPAFETFKKEKENLELKSAKMMAQFAELDPDPLIRIDASGKILGTNKATEMVFGDKNLLEKNIEWILPELNFSSDKPIISETKKIDFQHGMRHYSILYRGDADLQIAHLYFRDTSDTKEYEQRLITYQMQLKTLSESLQGLLEQERSLIARGLHDGIGQSLSFLRIKFLKMRENTTPEIENFFEDSIGSIEGIILELKNISYALKPTALEEMGLKYALQNMIDKISMETNISGEFNISNDEIRFEEKIEINIYRVVQEALTNIVKHSEASYFSVQVVNSPRLIRLIISDNGKGFNSGNFFAQKSIKSGMGLINMSERIGSLNGILKIDSSPGNGTMLVAEIPAQERDNYGT